MEIKVTRIEDGPAKVEVLNPDSGECVSSADVNVGQVVTITTSDSPENPPFIGEVTAVEETPAADGEEGQPGGGGESGGEESQGEEQPA